jgi:hypothetical protein
MAVPRPWSACLALVIVLCASQIVLSQAPAPAAAPAAPSAGAPPAVSRLPSFTGVVSCAPFTVLVQPTNATNASILFRAEPDVTEAVALEVVS